MSAEEEMVKVIAKAIRSVVNINTLKVFHDVFYRILPVKGMGSGFIIDEKGYVLTNYQIVSGG